MKRSTCPNRPTKKLTSQTESPITIHNVCVGDAIMRHASEIGQVMDLSNENVKLYVDINIY